MLKGIVKNSIIPIGLLLPIITVSYYLLTQPEEVQAVPPYCDVEILDIPSGGYQADQNNTYYCLGKDFNNVDPSSGDGAVEFTTKIENSTLDCLGYDLNGTDASLRYGVYVNSDGSLTSSTINITIKNCNISNFDYGIYDMNSLNTTIFNNTFVSNDDRGIFLSRNNYSTVINNTFENNLYYDIYIWGSSSYPGYHNIENNYMLGGSQTDAIYLDGMVQNCTVKNNTMITDSNDYSIYGDSQYTRYNTIVNNTLGYILFYDVRNNTIENNTIKSITLAYSTILPGASYNTIKNNIVKDGDGIKIEGSQYNTLINNTIYNVTWSGSAGIYLDTSGTLTLPENNNITGGSVHNNTYDYYIDGGTTNYFRNTNFTDSRTIRIEGANSWFNYNNETTGNIWLKTNVSGTATLTRKLINWNQSLIQWNDTVGGAVTARYNITGLKASTNYTVYNNSVSTYNLTTDSDGVLPSFIIYLSSEHEIKVQGKEHKLSGTLISTTKSESWYIFQVIPTWSSYEPTGTSITVYVSANGGTDWEQVTNDTTHIFSNLGKDFKYKAVFQTSNISETPTLHDVNFYYSVISNETITISTEINRNIYVGFFDITLIGSETTYKDKFQKNYTLP